MSAPSERRGHGESTEQLLRIRGRVWLFGDEVNTDEMFPGFAMKLPISEAARHMFDATRSDWPQLVRAGDVVIGGRRFGLGSSRPVPLLFKELGVAAILAEEFTSLFLRNCINYGLPAASVAGITSMFSEGDIAAIDMNRGLVSNLGTGHQKRFEPYPDFVLDLFRDGGVIASLKRRQLID